jgi:hypothetical protein
MKRIHFYILFFVLLIITFATQIKWFGFGALPLSSKELKFLKDFFIWLSLAQFIRWALMAYILFIFYKNKVVCLLELLFIIFLLTVFSLVMYYDFKFTAVDQKYYKDVIIVSQAERSVPGFGCIWQRRASLRYGCNAIELK